MSCSASGASFSATPFGIQFPTDNKVFIHNTVDPMDINKNIPTEYPLVGDSKLALAMLADAISRPAERQAARPRREGRGEDRGSSARNG